MPEIITWRILYVDDDLVSGRQVKELLEGEGNETCDFQVEVLNDFEKAIDELEARRYDLVILDVRVGRHDVVVPDEAGILALQAIKQRRFVPLIFYTGLPHLVQGLISPLIRVVDKTQGNKLIDEVKNLFATNLPAVNRALLRHLETVQRDYMWQFVTSNWDELNETPDRSALAYLLARRLALSLSERGIKELISDLGGKPEDVAASIHPMQYYIIPPVETSPLAGDIYGGRIGDEEGYWLLLSPSCDMVSGREKADLVLFVRCFLLFEQKEYTDWAEDETKSGNLNALLKNNRNKSQAERFFYLPGALTIPHLLVDFQQLVTIDRNSLTQLNRITSLDSPYAEALISRFARYYGRIGMPDLDTSLLLSRLKPIKSEAA
jgi:CheY-like chemotaxis protein